MLENQVVPITRSNLAFEATENEATGIYYNITRSLGRNDGRLENVERPGQPVLYFTQEDVDSNRIVYRPPGRELGGGEKDVFFYFTGWSLS